MDIDVGSITGDYQVTGILGAGGMGKVFKVRNVISDRQEAMKVLLPDLANAPELANRFLREIKVTASLDHPNIAALRTAVRVDNQLLMIMEYVEGVTLEAKLKQGPLAVKDAADYIGQALAALGYAHKLGVVHRDIKPANMMLTPAGVVKLMDFGIAKNAADRKLTQTGMTLGSLYYMSPEQIQGATDLDARADLYSLGITLYELVTGKRPFDGDSQFAIMSAHLQQQPVPPVELDPRVPAALNDVILYSVQKDPNARYQTAEAFREALQKAMAPPAPAPVQVAASTAPRQATYVAPAVPEPAKSRRGLWVAIGAAAAVAAVVGVIELAPKKNAAAEAPGAAVVTAPVTTPPPEKNEAPTPPQSVRQPLVSPPSQKSPAPTPAAAQVQRPPQTQQPVVQQSAPVTSPPVQAQQAPPPVQQQAAPPPAPAPDQAAKRAELMKVRESFAMFSARASAIRSTMQSMQRSQAASGLGMRSDWVRASSMMDNYLQAADDALKSQDIAAAQDFMGKAERQIDLLEKAFNK